MASNHLRWTPPEPYPNPAPEEFRSPVNPPFEVGDPVIMCHSGYRIKPGQRAEVRSIKWYERRGEWVMHVGWFDEQGRKESQGYRAYRFEKENDMNEFKWAFNTIMPNGDEQMSTFHGTRVQALDAISSTLKRFPSRIIQFGILAERAVVDDPPIKITKV